MKVQVERFHWNGHSTGFCPRTQKLVSPYKTPLFTLAVKGLNHLMTGKFWCGLNLTVSKKKQKNNHVCANIFKLAFIFSEIKNNFFCQIKMIYNYYISFLLLFNSQIQVSSQKKVQKNISYHSLIVTSAIPSPMSDNLNGRISPFIPLNKQTNKLSVHNNHTHAN